MNGDLKELARSQLFTLKGELVLQPLAGEQGSLASGTSSGTGTIANRLLASGEIIDKKYKTIKLLGQGGMGAVYQAHHLMLNKDVALKTFRTPNLTEEDLGRFQREAQAIAKLNHQNIVHVYDFGIDENNIPYYTMECLAGESLAERLEEENYLVLEEAVAIFLQVCQGMALAHSKGIIHRDIKPANIFLAKGLATGKKTEHVKIVDFGIAGLAVQSLDAQKLTSTGMIFGSPLYMSPEQSMGLEVTARSDIYSCGCALFETLTGSPPFRGVNSFATMLKHQTEPTPIMKSLPEERQFPKRLVGLTARMMAKSESGRPQSFDEVASELEEILHAYKLHYAGQNRRNHGGGESDNFAEVMALSSDALSVGHRHKKPIMIAIAIVGLILAVYTFAVLNPATNKPIIKTETPYLDEVVESQTKFLPYLQNPGKKNFEGRHFLFPPQTNLGYLRWFYKLDIKHELKRKKAAGEVNVPPGAFLTLEADDHVALKPDLLSGFGPNDLDEMIIDPTDPWHFKQMSYISNLTGLHKLYIAHSNIDDRSINQLNKLKNLEVLDVSATPLTGSALAKLEVIPRLTSFSSDGMQRVSAFLPKLKNSKNLISLNLNNCQLNDEDMKIIATISNLTELFICKNSEVTDQGLKIVSQLPALHRISLDGTSVSAQAIPTLKQMPLTKLIIDSNNWGKKDQEALIAALPYCKIEHHDPKHEEEVYKPPTISHDKDDLLDLFKKQN